MNVVWWGLRWPWQWRFYYVRRPEYGWAEMMLGFVGVLWAIETSNPAREPDIAIRHRPQDDWTDERREQANQELERKLSNQDRDPASKPEAS